MDIADLILNLRILKTLVGLAAGWEIAPLVLMALVTGVILRIFLLLLI